MNTTTQHGVYIVGIGRTDDPATLREAAYHHVGLALDGVDHDQTAVASSFTEAGFSTRDLINLIDGVHALRVTPSDETSTSGVHVFREGSGIDSEGNPTERFMLTFGGTDSPEAGEWLACAEAANAAWPRLLRTLGVSIGGVVFDQGVEDSRQVWLPARRMKKALRLKHGWDYDAQDNKVWLPIEEAWRRFVHHQQNRPDREPPMDDETLARMREHMEGYYAGRPTTRPEPATGSIEEEPCSTN